MAQILEIHNKNLIKIRESKNIKEIKNALETLLYVPTAELKPKILEELTNYLDLKSSDDTYKIKNLVACYKSEPCGFVSTLPKSILRTRVTGVNAALLDG